MQLGVLTENFSHEIGLPKEGRERIGVTMMTGQKLVHLAR
jgi:hypothetical protein